MLKSEVAPAYKSLCHESQLITTMFGNELPQSIHNNSQVKRMVAKSMGHDRRKASSSSSAYTNFKTPHINTSGYRRFSNYGRSNLNFHYEYCKPPYQRSQPPTRSLQRAPVQQQNNNELPIPNAFPQVGGHLAQFYHSWSNFTSDSGVLQAVSGYKIEFICEPFRVNKPHGIVFPDEEKKLIIDLEVQKMLQKGAIRHASFTPRQFVYNFFIIPKKSGDVRPVINLKPLHDFVQYHHF